MRASRKSRLRRQFLNSLRSNRRNCHPPSPAFSSCGPSCSNKSLKYNHGRRSLSRSHPLIHLFLLNSVTLSRTLRDSRDSCSISVLSGLSLAFLCCSELRSKGPRSDFSYEPCKKYEKFKENSQENHDFVQNKYLHKTRALE